MNDADIDIEILSINHDSDKGDILCYIYADNNLLDAVTLTEDLYEPAVTTLPSFPDQIIQIVAKDLVHGQPIGTIQFRLGLLLESQSAISLPMNSTIIECIPYEITKPFIQLKWYSKENMNKNTEISLEKNEENDMFKAMQSELEVEKWKNKGLKQMREEMTSSEMARISAMQKLQSIVDEYEKEISLLKKQMGYNPYDQILKQEKQIEEEYINALTEWKNKEKEYIENIALLEEEKYNQDTEISKLKSEGKLAKLELESLKSILAVEKIKNDYNTQEELLITIKALEDEIEEKQRELEINKKITDEALQQLSYFQVHNTFLRSHIESIEDKMQDMVKEKAPDIGKLVEHYLEGMSIPVKAVQVTENIFRIDNETIHLFIEKDELMAQQGEKKMTFVEWAQNLKSKNNHKRSKSEDTMAIGKETCNSLEACLDIVPEAEAEIEEEPQKRTTTPVRAPVYNKVIKRSPSGKIARNYSPILSKKKGK